MILEDSAAQNLKLQKGFKSLFKRCFFPNMLVLMHRRAFSSRRGGSRRVPGWDGVALQRNTFAFAKG